jgi:hypothetical protein
MEFRSAIRTIYGKDFGDVPIYGGWGHSQADAVIIDKYDPIVDISLSFNGIGLEYALLQHRNWIELIAMLPKDEQYDEIEFGVLEQKTVADGNALYDYIKYEITCFRHLDYLELKREWVDNKDSPDFDLQKHLEKRLALKKYLVKEIWFEISSFYGEDIFYVWNPESDFFFHRRDGSTCPMKIDPMNAAVSLFRAHMRKMEQELCSQR